MERLFLLINRHNPSTINIKLLGKINSIEINQMCLSYHGIDVNGNIHASPLGKPKTLSLSFVNFYKLIIFKSILTNSEWDPPLGISQTINTSSNLIWLLLGTWHSIYRGPSIFSSCPLRIFTFISDWMDFSSSSIPGYQTAADIALICGQLCVTLGILYMVKAYHYSGQFKHFMIIFWVGEKLIDLRLCQRVVGSINPGKSNLSKQTEFPPTMKNSETPHPSLLPMSGCLFCCCFKIMIALTNLSDWFKAANPASLSTIRGGHQPQRSQPTHAFASSNAPTNKFYQQQNGPSFAICDDDQVKIAKTVFAEVWNHQNHIYGELGTSIRIALPPRQGQGFILPLLAVNPVQVRESIQDLRECITRHPMVIKPDWPSPSYSHPTSSSTLNDVQLPPSTLALTTPPMGPSTTPTNSPPSGLPTTTGVKELVTNDEPTEGGTLFNKKTLATLKTINRTIKVIDDRAKYDVLVGINLSELLNSDQTNPMLDSATTIGILHVLIGRYHLLFSLNIVIGKHSDWF
ncbi:hypothetical protein MJO28_015716 [Puccinia striiformis f. sp. tritici]|uniref:Uncharacterized protein n=1 Tax=Puccinia striiformis f. sp. tritici TaxID=168172 RepID=A0ACC0DQ38_9BASI|nr:hypothetical protein MJO28_015716 [Puccinia striiformis f. sp. tritici]